MKKQQYSAELLRRLLRAMPPSLTPDLQDFWEQVCKYAVERLHVESELYHDQLASLSSDVGKMQDVEVQITLAELHYSLYHFCLGTLWLFERMDEQMAKNKQDFAFVLGRHLYQLGDFE